MKRNGIILLMHSTGIDKLLLFDYTEGESDSLIQEKGLTKYTDRTLTIKAKLSKELHAIKKGYAFITKNANWVIAV